MLPGSACGPMGVGAPSENGTDDGELVMAWAFQLCSCLEHRWGFWRLVQCARGPHNNLNVCCRTR
jgi:hypothetical protein